MGMIKRYTMPFVFGLLFIVIMFGIIAAIQGVRRHGSVWNRHSITEYANFLIAKGLRSEAFELLEGYVFKGRGSTEQIAQAALNLGQLYMQEGQYDKALKALYLVDWLQPEGMADTVRPAIVEALEKTGRVMQAQYELQKSVMVDDRQVDKSEVVARVGKKKITRSEIDEAIKLLPDQMRQQFSDSQSRNTFIHDYAVEEALYQKAKRRGLDKDPKNRLMLERFEKQVLVQDLISSDALKDVVSSTSELKKYYQSHKEDFMQQESVSVVYIVMDGLSESQARKRLKKGGDDLSGSVITKGQGYIKGIGPAKDAIEKLFELHQADISAPMQIGGKEYMFKVLQKKNAGYVPFEDIKQKVAVQYELQMQQKMLNDYLKNVLGDEDIEFYGFSERE